MQIDVSETSPNDRTDDHSLVASWVG